MHWLIYIGHMIKIHSSSYILAYCMHFFYSKVAQDPECTTNPSPFIVSSLTSNVKTSNRNFACNKEEIVYRCVTKINDELDLDPLAEPFITEWQWNGNTLGKMFNSTDIIGENNTCNTLENNLDFLHLTLVSAENDTCVSLLVVRSSVSSYVNDNVTIGCKAFGEDREIDHDDQSQLCTIQHTTISGESCMCIHHCNTIIIIIISIGNSEVVC